MEFMTGILQFLITAAGKKDWCICLEMFTDYPMAVME